MTETKPASAEEKKAPLTTEQRVTVLEQGLKNLEGAIIQHQHLQNGEFVMPMRKKNV